MDGLNEVMGGATDVAPVTQGNENGVTAAEPVQPAQPVEAAAPVAEAPAPGIAIERVKEVIERDPAFLGESAPPPAPPMGRKIGMVRQNRLENSSYFDQVKQRHQRGMGVNHIADVLYDQKAFPDLTLPGIRSMVARALMRAGLMKPDARVAGFSPRKNAPKPSRASFTSSQGGKMFSTHQLAKRYKVPDSSIRSWVKRGALNLNEVGATDAGSRGQWLFTREAIERWERKQETFQAITAVREFILRQRAAAGGKVEAYLSTEQVGARYGITGSGVNNWVARGVLNKDEILANGGFEGDGRTLFIPESYLIRWEKTPRAQELYSVQNYHAKPSSASRGEKDLNLNALGARYRVTGGAVWLWMKKGSLMKDLQRFFDKGSRSWQIPLSAIEQWESSPEARRAALTVPTLRRYFSKHPVAATVSSPRIGSSKEVDVSAIARKTGLPAHHIRRVLETVGIQPKALKLSQVAITAIEEIITMGGVAQVKKDKGSGTGFVVERMI